MSRCASATAAVSDTAGALLVVLTAVEPRVTDWMSGWGAVVTACVAVIAIFVAGWQVLEARRARGQTKELELEKSQPYVAMWAEVGRAGALLSEIVIKNFGPTAAREVRLHFPAPITRTGNVAGERELVGLPDVIPFLAPGQEWRTLWDNGPLPDILSRQKRFEGTVSYLGITEKQSWWKKPKPEVRRESQAVLDHSMWESAIFTNLCNLGDAVQSLQKVEEHLKAFKENGFRGLSVYVRSGADKDRREREYMEFARQKREEQAEARRRAAEPPRRTRATPGTSSRTPPVLQVPPPPTASGLPQSIARSIP